MSEPRLVIFDCDGVLVDSEHLSHTVLQQMLGELGVELSLEATYGHFMGTSERGLLQVAAGLLGRAVPADFIAAFVARTFDAFRAELRAVDGVHEVVRALPSPYCVASNAPREKMRFTLGHTGLLPHFEDRMFSAEDVERPKPAPDLFLHAARTMAARAEHCVVIEDSPTGVAAARAAGMRVLGYAAMTPAARLHEAGADTTFGHMRELPALLQAAHAADAGVLSRLIRKTPS
ncbi:HAD family hydrolase [Pseudaquabacterium terrae]|uniref:HAD family hydrolase n=1 Tax=Pseudaquabacterium terrae TaxID=2732868 RepID=UPI001C26BCC8